MAKNPRILLKKEMKLLREFHDKLIGEFDDVIYDQTKLINGWKIYFAVDYHHVYEYAHPFSNLISYNFKENNIDEHRAELSQKQAALAYLFHHLDVCEPPILLPPHIIELRNKLIFERFQNKAIIDKNTFGIGGSQILNEDEKEIIDNYFRKSNKNKKDIPQDVKEIIFDKFLDIFLFSSGLAGVGMSRINELIQSKSLQLNSKIVEENIDLIENCIKNPNSEFYELFCYLRKDSEGENYRDAKLIDIVIALNHKFEVNSEKNIVYLLSDAESMNKIFHPFRYAEMKKYSKLIKNIASKTYLLNRSTSIHRSINIFLIFLMAAKEIVKINHPKFIENRINIINELRSKKENLLTIDAIRPMFKDVINSCKENCDQCKDDQKKKCVQLKEIIKERKKIYRERISLSVLANRYPYLNSYFKLDDYKPKINESIFNIISFLRGKNVLLDKMIADQLKVIENNFKIIMDDLDKYVVEMADESIEDLIYRLKPSSRIPFVIYFRSTTINSKMKEINDYRPKPGGNRMDDLKVLSTDILDITKNQIYGDDRFLLLAILNYNYNQLERAIDILSELLRTTISPNKTDIMLMNCLALHQYGIDKSDISIYNKSIDLCNLGLKEFPHDPRWDYMYGVIVGRGIQQGLEKNIPLSKSLKHFEESLTKTEKSKYYEKNFVASIYNCIAFGLTLDNNISLDKINYAFENIIKMEKVLDVRNWDANFCDTKGAVLFLKAKYMPSESERRGTVNEAIKYFQLALKLARKHRYFSYEISAINKHIKEIKVQDK